MKLLICLFGLIVVAMADEKNLDELLRQGNEKFTARMFTEVVKQHPEKSVILSAFSVLSPLAQLSLASTGESHDELLKAIGLPNDNATKEVFSHLNTKLRSIKGVELKMANKVYIPEHYKLNDEFAAVSKNVFDSEVQNVDFTKNVDTAKLINTWVEDHTNHRIKDLVKADSLDSNTRAVLVNALYFKGSWKDKFNKDYTRERDFHVSKDKTTKIPFMFKETDFRYGVSEELNAALLEIPYEGDEASMLIVLPNEVDGLAALEEKLKNPSLLEKAIKEMTVREISVYLPKFKIETTTNLKEALENLDVKRLFRAGQANLSIGSDSDLYVSEATQKAFIEVNEDGAEAAAANVFNMVGATMYGPPKFTADKPFYFELRFKTTALFNGVYAANK